MWLTAVRGTVRRCGLALACTLPLVVGCTAPAPVTQAGDVFTPGGQSWEPAGATPPAPAPASQPDAQPDARPDPGISVRRDGDERAVEQAILGYWAEIARSAARPRARSPRLARYAAGRALQQWERTIRALAAGKRRYIGQPAAQVTAVKVRGRAATAVACVDSTAWVVVAATGARAGPAPATAYSYRLTKIGRVWKVTAQIPNGGCQPGR